MSDSDQNQRYQQLREYAKMLKNMTPLEVLESVAFDFRGNLTTIKGFAKLSLQSEDNQEYIEYINQAVETIVDHLQIVTEYIDDHKSNRDSQ